MFFALDDFVISALNEMDGNTRARVLGISFARIGGVETKLTAETCEIFMVDYIVRFNKELAEKRKSNREYIRKYREMHKQRHLARGKEAASMEWAVSENKKNCARAAGIAEQK